MKREKKANDFCTQLFDSWMRVDTAYLKGKKTEDTEKKSAESNR